MHHGHHPSSSAAHVVVLPCLAVCRWFGVLLYLVFLFIVVVILLNMLIAAMAATYSNVQSDTQRDLALARAWIVARVEHNSMLRIVRDIHARLHSHRATILLYMRLWLDT